MLIVVVLKSGRTLDIPVESQADADKILAACRQATTPPAGVGTGSPAIGFQPPRWLPLNGLLVTTSEVAAIYIAGEAPPRDNVVSVMEAVFGK